MGGVRKLWFTSATWIWWSVLIMGAAAAAGEDGNARPAPLLIKPVVGFTNNVGHDGPSTNAEPTVRIVGFDGLCAEVKDGDYHNGNGVRLGTCRSDDDPRQLWTVMKDGTIQSKGWCLTTYGYTPGDYVMIFNCRTAVRDATIWEISGNGSIINPKSTLALTAQRGLGTTLTVQPNIYVPGQGWQVTNETVPKVASIVAFKSVCMEENGLQLLLDACSSEKAEQKWAFYPDGTIRTNQKRDDCLTVDNYERVNVPRIATCFSATVGQRWLFTKEGNIKNLYYGSVIAVQTIIAAAAGTPNQQWQKIPV